MYGHSFFKSAFGINFWLWEVVKRKIHKYTYLRIFSLTISQSRKLIPKADLKWECPYFYSRFYFFKSFGQYFKKSNNGFPIVFSKSDLTGVGYIFWLFFFKYWPKLFKKKFQNRNMGIFRGFWLFQKKNFGAKKTRPCEITFFKIQRDSKNLLFSFLIETLQEQKLEYKYGPSHFKSVFGINFRLREVVKQKIRKYAYLRIFRLTNSRSRKSIPKADLKWETPYFYSKFIF